MMRIITLNVNGIRAAARKGFFEWLATQKADVVCLQEIRAHKDITDHELFQPEGFHAVYCDAEKKGYSGVAIYSKQKPDKIHKSLGIELAEVEGRYIQVDLGDLSIISLYLPSGSSGEHRQKIKFDFMQQFTPKLKKMQKSGRRYVLCGDINIVHKEIDIKNWKSNQKSSGCLPEERAWLDQCFDEWGWVDAFRVLNSQAGQYTWWSNRGRAWDNNVGWRIDYQMVTANLAKSIQSVKIYKAKRFSDHSPLIVDYAI